MRLIRHIKTFQDGGYMSMSIPQRKAYITNFFIQKGYTPVQSAAIVGNLQQENHKFDPTIKNSIGATGIAQWLGKGRKGILLQRNNPYSIDTQLNFLHDELQGNVKGAWTNNIGGKNAFFNTDDINQATLIIRKDFERPGEHEANDKRRYKYAQEALSLVDPNYKFQSTTTTQQTALNNPQEVQTPTNTLNIGDIYNLSKEFSSVGDALNEFKLKYEEDQQKKQLEADKQVQDLQKQQLLQAQQEKESLFALLTQPLPKNEQYNTQALESLSQQQSQPFRFQSDWFNPQQQI